MAERVHHRGGEAVVGGVVLGRRGAAACPCIRERIGDAREIAVDVVPEGGGRVGRRRGGEDVDAAGEIPDRGRHGAARVAVVRKARLAHHGARAGRSASSYYARLHAIDEMERTVREIRSSVVRVSPGTASVAAPLISPHSMIAVGLP